MSDILSKIKIFYSYSHVDEVLRKKLDDHLAFLKHDNVITWYDREIISGHVLDETIQKELNEADIILLLISSSFLSSFYCYEVEMKRAMERHETKEAVVVPVLLSDCVWQKAPFAKLLMTPHDAKPVNNPKYWATIDEAFTDVAKGLERTVNWVKENKFVQKKELAIAPILPRVSENKLSDYPKPNDLFTGRKTEIIEFQKAFNSSRIFAIEGLGGTGKTQFTAKCIEEIISDKNRIIWLNGSAQSNFDVFVENAGYGDVLKGEKKTDLELYSGLKDLIEKDARVIFWDNYNDYADPAFSKFLSFAHPYFQNATVILITKTDPSINGITSLPIIRLEGLHNDAIEYAKKLKASNIRYNSILDSDLEKICNGVEGHPLAIEFSMWLMGYGKSAEEIMLHMPEFSGLKKVEDFSKRLFLDIFNHPNTSEEERECFLKCSVFKERIKGDEIKFLYGGKDVFYLLAGLIDKLLITFKEGFYEIHPLVRSFSYEKLGDKKAVHKKAAEYFITQRIEEILNTSLEEKIFYHLSIAEEWESIADSIELIGRKLIQQGQLGLITEFMNRVMNSNFSRPVFEIFYGDIAQIKSDWRKAIIHFEKASQYCEDNKVKAEGMIKYGEILYRRSDIKEALPYFENAFEFAKTNNLRKEEARALNDVGLVYYDFDKPDIALEKYNSALKIRKEIDDKAGISASYSNIAHIFLEKGQNGKALEYYNESMKIDVNTDDKIALSLSFQNIGNVLARQNKLDEALLKYNLALKIREEIGDMAGIGYSLNNIGVTFSNQGKLKEGFLKYQESLKVREEIGDKKGIANCFANIGFFYLKVKSYDSALYYFFKSLDKSRQIGIKIEEKTIYGSIDSISQAMGKEKFKELANQAYKKLDTETQKNIQLKEFFNEPQIRETPKVGRNEPCPCGSGIKYKNCHGKIN